jgi:alpha-galactosidase
MNMNALVWRIPITLVAFNVFQTALLAATPPGELPLLETWVTQHLTGDAAEAPFSFKYGDLTSSELLHRCNLVSKSNKLDELRMQHELIYTDPETGLEIRCVAVEYRDFPLVEWTLYFKNGGAIDSPILSDIQALDVFVNCERDGEYVLHHYKGSRAEQDDFRPRATPLKEGTEVRLSPVGGRGSNGTFPYFNLEGPEKGLIVAIGWPGQWNAQFVRDFGTKLRISAGQEHTHFKLLPGEEARSPLVVLEFYEGDVVRAQNIWRRWMIKHNLPRVDNQLPQPQLVACSSHQFGEMINANEENQKHFVDRYVHEGLGISHWWMDAGWYVNDGQWVNTGTWEVDRTRFPHGLRAITEYAHTKNVKSIVWFEPERVTPHSWLYDKHPEWLFALPPDPGNPVVDADWRLLNLGNANAREWLIEHIDHLIKGEGIDVYRQDFNIDPLPFWQAADDPDRQGIAEIKHVTGYLTFWDELRKRNPRLIIDTCASGGRRLDLETLRRSVPLLRSDFLFEPIGQQVQTYSLAKWVPYNGTGILAGLGTVAQPTPGQVNSYDFRSQMVCNMIACWDLRDKNLDYEGLRRLFAQFRDVSPNFLGDFYPLTSYSTDPKVWMAWQYDRPEIGVGLVQAFRRRDSPLSEQRFPLNGLDTNAQYVVRDLDTDDEIQISGAELVERGLSIVLSEPRSASLIEYRKVDKP